MTDEINDILNTLLESGNSNIKENNISKGEGKGRDKGKSIDKNNNEYEDKDIAEIKAEEILSELKDKQEDSEIVDEVTSMPKLYDITVKNRASNLYFRLMGIYSKVMDEAKKLKDNEKLIEELKKMANELTILTKLKGKEMVDSSFISRYDLEKICKDFGKLTDDKKRRLGYLKCVNCYVRGLCNEEARWNSITVTDEHKPIEPKKKSKKEETEIKEYVDEKVSYETRLLKTEINEMKKELQIMVNLEVKKMNDKVSKLTDVINKLTTALQKLT